LGSFRKLLNLPPGKQAAPRKGVRVYRRQVGDLTVTINGVMRHYKTAADAAKAVDAGRHTSSGR
jgi:hypothetical protein